MSRLNRSFTDISLTLTPFGTLRFAAGSDGSELSDCVWQEGLFLLGAARDSTAGPVQQFWGRLAAACIRELCHAANPEAPSPLEADALQAIPLPEVPGSWLAMAPPMPGGEYLSESVVQHIWEELLAWCASQVTAYRGLTPFLQAYAPKWQQVGRVFFHLAENKLNTERPFVFLATYTTGFNASGQLKHTPLSRALQYYGAENNVTALKHLLQPVMCTAEHLPWVSAMVESKALFAPRAWLPAQAYTFLTSVPVMEEDGIGVRLPDWWKKRARPRVKVSISNTGTKQKSLTQAMASFDISLALGDETLTEEELQELLAAECGLTFFKGQWVEVDREKLQQVLSYWEQVQASADGVSCLQGLRMLAGFGSDAADMSAEEQEDIQQWSLLEAGAGFRELFQAARGEIATDEGNIPGLEAVLRPYQVYGVSWMRLLGRLGMGACLADDMGLGKTVQVLALLLSEKEREKDLPPSLLIVPASLLANWKAEAARFAPSLRFFIVHPSEQAVPRTLKAMEQKGLDELDLVITTYSFCSRLTWLKEVSWRRIILDEAQAIKNAGTGQSKAVRALSGTCRIAMTGTPIENSLADLWALFDFLNPGLLGSAKSFGEDVAAMEKSRQGLAPLRRVTAPYILRRLKTDKRIIDSLPDKIETNLICSLTKEQARIYQQLVKKIEKGMEEGGSGRELRMLQYITLLKQLCNHPAQAGIIAESGSNYAPERSGKFKRIGELCTEIASRQERVLIFTQFKEIIEPLSDYLAGIFGRPGLSLHGSVAVKKRGELVRDFQREDGPPFFILSLKAGGTGLNLTRASHVIHFDRWWNPAVENQATDRAFRIGQKNNVLVHKCITRGTIEEHIDQILQRKGALSESVLGSVEESITSMSDAEFLDLVRLDLKRAVEDQA